MAILQAADLATADGMPLVWASRLLEACALKERVAGADLVPLLSERAAQKGYTIYLYGSAPGIAERAARKLVSQYEGLKIVGCYAPAFSDALEISPEVKAEILDSTLREGEQTPLVNFMVEEKVEIARMLDQVGVEMIEAGDPSVSPMYIRPSSASPGWG